LDFNLRPHAHEEKNEEDLDDILNQIEDAIKKMGRELSDVYYESLRCKEDTAKRLELEDKRKDLRKSII
jgi:hypothetical protein